jgi:hypothetical protein
MHFDSGMSIYSDFRFMAISMSFVVLSDSFFWVHLYHNSQMPRTTSVSTIAMTKYTQIWVETTGSPFVASQLNMDMLNID